MSTYAATIESNGYVLAIRGPWVATPGSWTNNGSTNSFDRPDAEFQDAGVNQFPLAPDGAAKITVNVTSPGFNRVAGEAVATGRSRSMVATRPLRKPYPDNAQLAEIDHGDGTRTVRIALSDRVYAADTVTSVVVSAGWKVGQAGETISGAALTNASTRVCPLVVARAAVLPYRLVRGATSVHCDWIVASHYPSTEAGTRHQPIAAAKIVATDGTNSVTTWLTGLQNSPLNGDSLRCVGGLVDLSGLTAGVVTILATFYPWVGAARSIGSAHVANVAGPFAVGGDEPLTICYDPDSNRYPAKHIFVDPATGTTTAASVTVANDLAGAKAGTASADVSTAVQALYLANLPLAAGNGQTAKTRAADWCVITLAAGASTWGATAVTSGFTGGNEGAIVVQGDPANPDPRANCILRSGTSANPNMRNSRWWFRDLTVEAGQVTFITGTMLFSTGITVRGKAGYTADTNVVFSSTAAVGTYITAHTNLKWTDYGIGLSGANQKAGLVRNAEHPLSLTATTYINVTRGSAPAPLTVSAYVPHLTAMTDFMIWNCTVRNGQGKAILSWPWTDGAGTVANPYRLVRAAIVNSLFERSGAAGDNFWSMGELGYTQMQDSVMDSNTYVGQRVNFHNDSAPDFVDLLNINNVARNEYHDWQATKHDMFAGGDSRRTGSWEWPLGVGKSGNVFGNRVGAFSNNFNQQFPGLNAAFDGSYPGPGSNGWTKFTTDNSQCGPGGSGSTGNGDYRPAAGSPLLGRGTVSTIDQFADGTAKGATFAAGGRREAAIPAVRLKPAGGGWRLSSSNTVLDCAYTLKTSFGLHRLLAAPVNMRTTDMVYDRRGVRTRVVEMEQRRRRVEAD